MERDAGLAAPVGVMPDRELEQESIGESITSSSASPQRHDEVQSRYLSPHMASCHDFCKYGKKKDSEVETRRLAFRKFLKNKKKSAQNAEQNEVTILVAGERRTGMGTTPKAKSKVEIDFPGNPAASKPRTPPRTPPSIKNSTASGEKKTHQSSLAIKQGTKSKPTSNMETEFPNNARVPTLETVPPVKDIITSDAFQPSFEDVQDLLKNLIPKDEKKVKAIRREPPRTPVPSKASPASDMEASGRPNIIEKETKASVKKPSSPDVPKVTQKRASPSVSPALPSKPKVLSSHKRADSAGKPAIALKTKTPLIRSLSQRKSSKSLIAQNNKVNKTVRSLGISENGRSELSEQSTVSSSSKSPHNLIDQRNLDDKAVKSLATLKSGETKKLKPNQSSFSSKIHDNEFVFQLRKLRSVKRTSTSHDSVFGSQLRKLRSTKKNSTPQDTDSNLRPSKLQSIKHTQTSHNNVSSLPPRRLKSIKQTSAPHDGVPSLQPRKVWSSKQTSTFRDIVSRFQPRKLRSMKRSSSLKDGDQVWETDTKSKSGNSGPVPNPKTEDSECSIPGVNDKEIQGDNKVEMHKNDEKRRSRRAPAIAARPEESTSTPFKLKFRRGKVINLRSDSIGARRLWFNIGLLAADNSNSNGLLWRRNSRRKSSTSMDFKELDSEVQSVVLKHQGVTEKKDSKSLFNHVIEETASKLVETRKSKVKALVGAFETVISLQEKKPVPTV